MLEATTNKASAYFSSFAHTNQITHMCTSRPLPCFHAYVVDTVMKPPADIHTHTYYNHA